MKTTSPHMDEKQIEDYKDAAKICFVAFINDKYIAVARYHPESHEKERRSLKLFDARTKKKVCDITLSSSTRCITLTPDGKYAMEGRESDTCAPIIWNLEEQMMAPNITKNG